MSYILYSAFSENASRINIDLTGIRLNVIKPKLNSLHNVLWTIFSLGEIREYQLVDSMGEVLAYAQVMPKIFIFGFMNKGDIHIGPCYTKEHCRGRGFYPYMLSIIMKEYKDKHLFIFCDKENTPSQKGITKAGFKPFGIGYKSFVGIYKEKAVLLVGTILSHLFECHFSDYTII